MSQANNSKLHIVMFPWFAIGHIAPYLHLANELAERGCKITVLLPNKAKKQLQQLNYHPDSVNLHPLTIPAVNGLPAGSETTSDVPVHMEGFLKTALDYTRDQVEKVIRETKPALVMHDVAHWMPEVTKPLGIKTMNYIVVCASAVATCQVLDGKDKSAMNKEELAKPPAGYPSSTVVLRPNEAHTLSFLLESGGENISLYERMTMVAKGCDVISLRTCYEVEGKFCDFIAAHYNKQVLVAGLVLPEAPKTPLERRWDKWLSNFERDSVVFCAFGGQLVLDKQQFQELCLGFELTGLPFLAALKPPIGASTVEEALPEGFQERVKGRGVVWGGWVQQVQILNHPSVGCFVNHCGCGTMWESLMSDCQLVLLPTLLDQTLNTRLLANELKVGVEVEREENGWLSKENLSKAIKAVMDKDSELASTLKKNHAKWKDTLTRPGLMSGYIDKLLQHIQELVK